MIKRLAFDMEMIFHSHTNKTHFHKKGCVLDLILKVRVFGTRKRPIVSRRVCVTLVQQMSNNVDAARRLDKDNATCP